MPPQLAYVTTAFGADPVLDMAVSRALLVRVAAGQLPDTLRIAVPGPAVLFGRRDVVSAGYPEAVAAARAAGFEPVERLAGGRAAVFHDGTVSVAHACADRSARASVRARFDGLVEIATDALARLGVDARVGAVPGEYCPGADSVNARGQRKLVGVGQRIVAGGAHVGAVAVADGAGRINAVLTPVYAALGLDWRPEATGAVSAEAPGAGVGDLTAALEREYARRYELVPVALDDATLALAAELAGEHRPAR